MDLDMQTQVEGLRRQVHAGRRRSVLLANGALAAVLLGTACWAAYYGSRVASYARLDPELGIRRDPVDPDRLAVVFRPTSSGKVGFRRRAADRETELLERVVPAAVGTQQTFQWRIRGVGRGDTIRVTFRRGMFLASEVLTVPAPAAAARLGDGTLTGQIVNAVNNEPVPGAEVRVLGTPLSARAGADGSFRLAGAPVGQVPLEVSAAGFITEPFDWEVAAGGQTGIRVVLSPGMEAGQARIVLTWDREPADLDAHLEGPLPDGERFHVYFHEKGDLKSRQFVRLDVDDRDGQGPETITVLGVLPGTYRYFVHDYSHRDDPQSNALARSGAEVKVYQGGQTYRFRAGHDMVGNVWDVCTVEVGPEGAVVQKTDTYEGTRPEALGLYAKRTLPDRPQWIGSYGGSTISEQAVQDGLEWLARHQAGDGSWSNRCLTAGDPEYRCEKDAPCGGPGKTYEMAHTGLAVLAFQAAGHYYFNRNTYSDQVRAGLDWMVAHQRSDGGLIGSKPRGRYAHFHKNFMYEHGIATFALADAAAAADAVGSSEKDRYLEAVEKAVRFIQQMQHADGGWRYTDDLKRPGDTSVTGWQVLALKSAIEAGIPVGDECVQKVGRFFEARAMGENGRTGYRDRIPATEATTGVGMLARQFLLGRPDAPLVRDAAAYLAGDAERSWSGRKAAGDQKDFYLWYNCTLAMFQAGGEPWQRWNGIVRDTIVNLQRHDGCARGSWDPTSKWGDQGGRIYTTALAVLTLEVYYRYAGHDEAAGPPEWNVTSLDGSPGGTQPDRVELNAEGDRTPKGTNRKRVNSPTKKKGDG